jgi:hypothetical protein
VALPISIRYDGEPQPGEMLRLGGAESA